MPGVKNRILPSEMKLPEEPECEVDFERYRLAQVNVKPLRGSTIGSLGNVIERELRIDNNSSKVFGWGSLPRGVPR